MSAPAGVLLIDLENMIGNKARPNTLKPRLDALISQAGPGLLVVAACAGSRITQEGREILKDRRAKLLVVDAAKGAADKALLQEAHRLAGQGHHRFVVASADRAFAQIADLGQLEIMLWEAQAPQKNAYTERATKVHRVAKPLNGTSQQAAPTPAKPAKAPKLLKAATVASPKISTTGAPAKTPPGELPHPASAPARSTAKQRASQMAERFDVLDQREAGMALLIAGAIFAAGAIFGAGTVVGAAATRLLLKPGP